MKHWLLHHIIYPLISAGIIYYVINYQIISLSSELFPAFAFLFLFCVPFMRDREKESVVGTFAFLLFFTLIFFFIFLPWQEIFVERMSFFPSSIAMMVLKSIVYGLSSFAVLAVVFSVYGSVSAFGDRLTS